MNFLVGVCLASGGAIIQIDATFFFGLITTPGTSPSVYFNEPQIWILVEFVGVCISVVSMVSIQHGYRAEVASIGHIFLLPFSQLIYMLLWPCISDSKECCKTSVAPSNEGENVILINRGPRLAFEEQPPAANIPENTNPMHSGSRMDSNSPPSFAEATLSRNVVNTVASPSAPPMNEGRYLQKSLPPLEMDRGSFAEETPTEDNARLV